MYAVMTTGGKQYKVQVDDIVDIERIAGETGEKVTFSEVLAIGDEKDITIGTPTVKKAKVEGEIVDQFRGDKLTIFKMKKRKGYRRKQGHRQELTKVKIAAIKKG